MALLSRFRRMPRLTFLHWIILVAVFTALVMGVGAWGLSKIWARQFPNAGRLKDEYPVILYQGPKKPFQVKLQKTRPPGWTPYGEISRYAIGAVIVSEDSAFFQHEGYDPEALRLAVREDLAEGRFARGASTIPMQVVKNVFLSQEKSIIRKLREFFLAIQLDEQVSKKRILEVYFNIVELGEGIFGIRRASQHYFKKGPSELTPKEAAFIAMLLPSPKRYSQSYRSRQLSRYASRTISKTLQRMAKGRFMPYELLESELATPLSFEIVTSAPPPVEPPEEGDVDVTAEDSTPRLVEESSEGEVSAPEPAPPAVETAPAPSEIELSEPDSGSEG